MTSRDQAIEVLARSLWTQVYGVTDVDNIVSNHSGSWNTSTKDAAVILDALLASGSVVMADELEQVADECRGCGLIARTAHERRLHGDDCGYQTAPRIPLYRRVSKGTT